MIPFEREHTFEQSLGGIVEAFNRREVAWQLDARPFERSLVLDTHATVQTVSTRFRESSGHGKGAGLASICGSLYEAFEHLVFEGERFIDMPDGSRLAGTHPRCGGDVLLDAVGTNAALTDRQFRSFDDPGVMVALPSEFCGGPSTGEFAAELERTIRSYYSNNGWAAGASREEAELHALNELVERDALSAAFVSIGLNEPWGASAALDPAQELVKSQIEAAYDIEIEVAILPAVAGHVAVAYCLQDRGPALLGSGASLSEGHAVSRAINEFLQQVLAGAAIDQEEQRRTARMQQVMSRYRNLAQCLRMTPHYKAAKPFAQADSDIPLTTDIRDSVAAQLGLVVEQLANEGFIVYSRVVAEELTSSCRPSVVQVIVPGLERFHVISHGYAAEPIGRFRSRASVMMARETC